MATLNINEIMDLAPRILKLPTTNIWTSFDSEADVLYLNFKKPSHTRRVRSWASPSCTPAVSPLPQRLSGESSALFSAQDSTPEPARGGARRFAQARSSEEAGRLPIQYSRSA